MLFIDQKILHVQGEFDFHYYPPVWYSSFVSRRPLFANALPIDKICETERIRADNSFLLDELAGVYSLDTGTREVGSLSGKSGSMGVNL